ncbi:ribokinase [Parafrankia colletiae]|uniref:Ribokinase n=1 Tax=Parafrankia colletiae TaxID=573497 RepID=A0A1S1QNI1_9ACTN|nr:carbohydrate kinase family protein [Parafrankia colletiae]MCK9904377.1 carbohydrate kinase family protein [Frankia sp. Cpl3]OHV35129.1 ribokinase [Parafrankia colletiae]
MRIAVTGSIATDHLMRFPGRFAEQLLADQLERVSLSFLVDELSIRRGGVAANITFGLGRLGLNPILVGAVGEDFADYRSWLDRHGVDTASVRVSEIAHTARFVCTTDNDLCQIASFYPGAMSEAASIELRPVAERFGGLDLVVVSPNDPQAMLRHTEECRERGYPFAADPSQQLATMDGDSIRSLVDGAAYLFCNEYEKALLASKTGLTDEEILATVGVRVTTLGKDGVVIESADGEAVKVPVVPARSTPDPTGVGDAFRAGFLAGISWELPLERSAQVGALLATMALETVGTQEYSLEQTEVVARLTEAYGAEAAAEVAAHLRSA